MLASLQPAEKRPDSEIGKGLFSGSKGLFIGLGIGSIVFSILIVVIVVRSRLKAKRGDDLGPISSRRSGPASSRPPRTKL